MKKRSWMLLLVLVLSIPAIGCNMAMSAGETQTQAPTPTPTVEKRLDAATWPTAEPTVVVASPTPFPKVTLVPTATRTPIPTPYAAATTEGQISYTGNPQELVQQVVTLSGGFTPAGAALVLQGAVEVREGPGETYAPVGSARSGEMVAVLGKNAAGDWFYLLTQSVVQGWLPSSALQMTLSLGEPPVLPENPQAPDSSESGLSELLTRYAPVAAGVVTAQGVSARQGPGADYPALTPVETGEQLGVFGTNAGGDWLYIVTISGTMGWVPADSVRVMGSLDEAPVLPANPVAPPPTKAPATPKTTESRPTPVVDLKEVAKATVDSAQVNMRQGPGPDYGVLLTLQRGETLSVLALNKARDWALVATADGTGGWVYLEYLSVSGSLDDAPTVTSAAPNADLTPDRIAPVSETDASGGGAVPPDGTAVRPTPTGNKPAPVPSSTPLATGLGPVAEAVPGRDEVIVYRGPGVTYEPVVKLHAGDSASVVALSQDAPGWALVLPHGMNIRPGWAALSDLKVQGSLEGAPQVTTAWIVSNEVPVRAGPGMWYPRTGTLAIDTLVSVWGLDKGRGWALVALVPGGNAGWIPLNYVTPGGRWADLAELPDTLLAQSAPVEVAAASPVVVPAGDPVGRLAVQLSSGGDIMLIDADGSGLHRLTSGIDPMLSPDGYQVAFTRWNGEDGSLWVINADGSGERAVLGATKQAKHPAWSPDGSRIVVNFQSGGRLTEHTDCENYLDISRRDKLPAIPWNVDGDSVRIEMRNGVPYLCWELPPDAHWALRVVNVSDGGYQDMPSDRYAFGPEWDPANGWRIISSGQGGLVQLDANRAEQWALTDQRGDHTPAFSPDGHYVAVAHDQNGSTYDIHRLHSDGSGRVRLTQTPLWVTAAPEGGKQWNNVAPAWSPDGARIAFLTDRTGRWEVWLMNWDGSNPHPMFSDEVNDQLPIRYEFVDERVLSWR